jgi:hypothetical protein
VYPTQKIIHAKNPVQYCPITQKYGNCTVRINALPDDGVTAPTHVGAVLI